jgi:prolyl-tRNA editing enzyme YbaK/EbsC (Cys-tRNA(Pro) deacylase)
LIDPSLCAFDQVYGAAGTPRTLFSIAPDRLVDLTDATVVDFTE